MPNLDNQLDITKNIKMIEILKTQLLSGVSDLYCNLASTSKNNSERLEIFADLIIINYILANKLGISHQALDLKINKKLKILALEKDNNFNLDAKELLKYFNNKIN